MGFSPLMKSMSNVWSTMLSKGLPGNATASVTQSGRKSDEKSLSTDDKKDEFVVVPKASPPSKIPGLSQDELIALFKSSRGSEDARGEQDVKKHWQYISADTAVPTAAATTANIINAIPQGTSSNYTRLGLAVRGHHVTLRLKIYWNNTSSSPASNVGYTALLQPVRFVVYIDRMPPVGGSIWAENVLPPIGASSLMNTTGVTGTFGATDFNTLAVPNLNTHGVRYHILHDKVYVAQKVSNLFNGSDVCAANVEVHEIHIPLGWTTRWYGTSSTDLMENSLEYQIITDVGSTTWQAAPRWSLGVDYSYSDIAVE